jgi:hypothetical protein
VWYSFVAPFETFYGVDTTLSDYDTVVSVYTGSCGSLSRVACSDDFGNPADSATRSVLAFSTTPGVTYLIEASGKGNGGSLRIRVGYPTITNVMFTGLPSGPALIISGAGFFRSSAAVTVRVDGEDIALPDVFGFGPPFHDGADAIIYATRNKLKKLFKRGNLLVSLETPIGSGNFSNTFLFTR